MARTKKAAGSSVEAPPPVQKIWTADTIEHWPIERLVPYARNARVHSPEQVDQLARSIQEFGFTIPVLVDEEGELIAGHGRVMAATKLGLSTVPTMVARNWSTEKVRAYRIADNKLALNATWNPEFLAMEIAELREFEGFDLDILGFSPIEMARIAEDARLTQLEQSEGEGAAGPGEGAGSEDELAGAPQMVNFTLAMSQESRDLVFAAIAKAKHAMSLNTSAEALLAIIAAWTRSIEQ